MLSSVCLLVVVMSGNDLSNISMSLSLGKFKHLVQLEMEHCNILQLNISLLGTP
jgi:hypothetical protein